MPDEEINKTLVLKDIEYPTLDLIVCRKGRVNGEPDEKFAYIEGSTLDAASITLRLENLGKGEYYILYRPNFREKDQCRRLNIVLYSEFM